MLETVLYASGAAIIALIVGVLIGFTIADRRLRRLYEDVREEIVRVRRVAQDKLAPDEPGLDSLMQDFNDAVSQTFKAAEALDHHEKAVIRKTEAGKEIAASSRHIINMIDELAGEAVERSRNKLSPRNKIEAKRPPRLG